VLSTLQYYYRNYVLTLSYNNPKINLIVRYFTNRPTPGGLLAYWVTDLL